MSHQKDHRISRRSFIGKTGAATLLLFFPPWTRRLRAGPDIKSRIFQVSGIPSLPFTGGGNSHAGVEALLTLLGGQGLKFLRSNQISELAGPEGMIAADDVVLIKVNAQWKYRGCTNSDVVRGLIQRVLEHPDGFSGEVVIVENGQGRGSLNCDTSSSYNNDEVHANAVNEKHSFLYLVEHVFIDPRVSAFGLDPIRSTFIDADDHQTNGYRRYENVSYPCFTSAGGRRVELREGVWTGSEYRQNLKLINVPVLKHHGTSELTAALKHMYGLVSMNDGNKSFRHYDGLGETCGKMMVSVRTPALNIVDAIWVSHKALSGYPASSTHEAKVLLASQDPVALDYWAAKAVLYPIDQNSSHHPDNQSIRRWLAAAETIINQRGGLYNPEWGIMTGLVTCHESRMVITSVEIGEPDLPDRLELASPNGGESWPLGYVQTITWKVQGNPGTQLKIQLLKGGDLNQTLSTTASLSAGSFSWKVPSSLPPGNDYTIRIISRQNSALRDASDQPFSIGMAPPGSRLTMISPNGGESWKRGSNQAIVWNYNGQPGGIVKVTLLKGGDDFRVIASSTSLGSDGSGGLSWAIPADLPAAGNYRIQVRSRLFAECRDKSDQPFTIT
jgi:uncharacterized protein (DUF362 family)